MVYAEDALGTTTPKDDALVADGRGRYTQDGEWTR
jgi:hypothetical protein